MDRFSNWTINTGHHAYHEPAEARQVSTREFIGSALRNGVSHVAPRGDYLWTLALGVSYEVRDSEMPPGVMDHAFSILHARISITKPLMVCLVLRPDQSESEARGMVRWLARLTEKGITWKHMERSLDQLVEDIVSTRPALVTLLMGEPHIAFGLVAGENALRMLSSFCTCVADTLLAGEPVPYDVEHYKRLIGSQTS